MCDQMRPTCVFIPMWGKPIHTWYETAVSLMAAQGQPEGVNCPETIALTESTASARSREI